MVGLQNERGLSDGDESSARRAADARSTWVEAWCRSGGLDLPVHILRGTCISSDPPKCASPIPRSSRPSRRQAAPTHRINRRADPASPVQRSAFSPKHDTPEPHPSRCFRMISYASAHRFGAGCGLSSASLNGVGLRGGLVGLLFVGLVSGAGLTSAGRCAWGDERVARDEDAMGGS